jgi:hypothetical protein
MLPEQRSKAFRQFNRATPVSPVSCTDLTGCV